MSPDGGKFGAVARVAFRERDEVVLYCGCLYVYIEIQYPNPLLCRRDRRDRPPPARFRYSIASPITPRTR